MRRRPTLRCTGLVPATCWVPSAKLQRVRGQAGELGSVRRLNDMYTALFVGLPVVGLMIFGVTMRAMAFHQLPSPPVIQMFAVFAAYGAVILFAVSSIYDMWSAMHSLAALVLIFIGTPWLLVQGVLLLKRGTPTRYHRSVAALSLAFPVVLVALHAFASVSAR